MTNDVALREALELFTSRLSRADLLYQVLAFESVLLCGILAAISLYIGLPLFGRAKPRWIASGATWVVIGMATLLSLAA